MSREDYNVAVAAMNGRAQRIVSVDRADGREFRDHINPDSATARQRFVGRAATKFAVEASELSWLDDAIVQSADTADEQVDAAVSAGDREERKSQATQLVELAASAELFHDADNEAFARFSVEAHSEVAGVRTRHFRRWLARLFYLSGARAPSSQAMHDAINVLEGKAIFEGDKRTVHVRVAEHEDKIYLDLCNDAWQVVEISTAGWHVLDESPVAFRRAKAMLPLPLPVKDGAVAELRRFVHMADAEWTLFVAWLVAALRPTGPYPVLDIQGEHGSGKSTACRMARALLDPNTAMIRSEPREPRDLMIASKNGWIIAFDNLSGIQAWQSDCLCRLATGGGFSTRTLYENDEETIFDAQRPSIINGIDDVATRADLLDRCLLLNLPRIEQDQRRSEADLWKDFDEAQPRILGALLTATACALKNIDTTVLPALPRMADFALWATAAEPALGWSSGQFIAAYQANRAAGNEVALEASPVGKAVIDFVSDVGEWSGTSTELLHELIRRVDDATKRQRAWPATARPLGAAVKRLAPNLREAGIDVEFSRKGKRSTRLMVFKRRPERDGNFASLASATSAMDELPGNERFVADATADASSKADANHNCFASDSNSVDHGDFVTADANDIADANLQLCSDWHDEYFEPDAADSSEGF